MTLIMTTIWYPPGKAKEVGKKYLEVVQKYPDDESISKSILRGGFSSNTDGIKGIAINEVKKGKFTEAINRATRICLLMAEVEGLTYKIEALVSLEEAMPMIGLSAP